MSPLRVGAWAMLAGGIVTATWAAVVPVVKPIVLPAGGRRLNQPVAPPHRGGSDSLTTSLVRAAPFRATRMMPGSSYDPQRQVNPPPPSAPKPVLSLIGLVIGSDPSAVIEGFPAIDGARVVRRGDVVGLLQVEGIGGESVRIRGMDTVWVLKVRRPW